jgi:predicted nucleic-acid-binding protein
LIETLVGNPALDDGGPVVEALHAARAGADFADALIRATGRLHGVAETVTVDRRAAERLGRRLLVEDGANT